MTASRSASDATRVFILAPFLRTLPQFMDRRSSVHEICRSKQLACRVSKLMKAGRAFKMQAPELDVVLKRFESPDETRQMTKGRFELVTLGGVTIGRATYEPGWKW